MNEETITTVITDNTEDTEVSTETAVSEEPAEFQEEALIGNSDSGRSESQLPESVVDSSETAGSAAVTGNSSPISPASHPAQPTQSSSNTLMRDMVASPQPPSEGKAIRLNAGIHIEANRKNIRSHRGSYSLSDKAYRNLVRLAEITNNSYNEIFNRLLEDIEFEDVITE